MGSSQVTLEAVLNRAGVLLPIELRSLDAIHLATAGRIGKDRPEIETYGHRIALAAQQMGHRVSSPS